MNVLLVCILWCSPVMTVYTLLYFSIGRFSTSFVWLPTSHINFQRASISSEKYKEILVAAGALA